jgi:DNA-binding NarL/FixJ family response regulator
MTLGEPRMDTDARRIRVLVADDQAIIRDGLATVLSLLPDIEIVGEASDGEEAVRLVGETDPDVVLMDLRMPVLDGAGATARITVEYPRTSILVLTTFADDVSILAALRAGARGYLTKDAGRAEVASAVRAVAQGQTTFGPEVAAKLIGSLTGGSQPGLAATPGESGGIGGSGGSGGIGGSGGSGGIGGIGESVGSGAPGGSLGSGGTQIVGWPTQPHPDSASVALRFPSLTQREADVLALVGRGLNNREIAEQLFVSVATVKTHINAIFAKLGVRDRAQAIALVRS